MLQYIRESHIRTIRAQRENIVTEFSYAMKLIINYISWEMHNNNVIAYTLLHKLKQKYKLKNEVDQ